MLKTLSLLACVFVVVVGWQLNSGRGGPAERISAQERGPSSADPAKDDKPALSGLWGKKDGQLKIDFSVKNVVTILPHGDRAVIAIECDCALAKEGLVKAKVTKLEGNEEIKKKVQEHVPVGLEFKFKWTMTGDAAKLDELSSDKNIDILKSHLEGEFEKN